VLYENFGHILTGEIPRRYGKLADLVSYDLGLLKFVVANSLVFRDQEPSVAPDDRQPLVVWHASPAIIMVQMAHVPDRVSLERRQHWAAIAEIFVEIEYVATTLPSATPLPT